jgi:phosphoribosylamine--glycine ligase
MYFSYGPPKIGAQLEGKQRIAKEFMVKHNIPTAAYDGFTERK